MRNLTLANLTRTMQNFFRFGTLRIKDESGKLAVRNGADSANADLAAARLHVRGSNASNAIILTAPALGGDVTLTLPADDGDAGEVLRTNGSGVLSWDAAGGGTFISLSDTPSSYSGQVGKVPIVNGAASALEFAAVVPGTGSVALPHQYILTFVGTVSPGLNPLRMSNSFGVPLTITRVRLVADLGPTGSAIVVDILKNGTTIFTNSANRPQIAAGATTGETTTIDVPTWAANDQIQAQVISVGQTIPGADMVVFIDAAQQGNIYLDDLIDVDIDTTPPDDGDALVYNSTTSKWEPVTVTTDHGELSGLADDDHTHYHTDARGDARYSLLTHDHDADYSDIAHDHDADYSLLGHTHDDRYFQESEHIDSSLGVLDGGKPVKLDALGLLDDSFLSIALDELTDVDVTTVPPSDGQGLVYSQTGSKWIPGDTGGQGGGVTSTMYRLSTFTIAGDVAVGAGLLKLFNQFGATQTIVKVHLSVYTAPTGQALIVDIKNGLTSVFTQGNRPQIAADAHEGFSVTVEYPQWNAGQYLTFSVDQIGSGVAGADLTIQVVTTQPFVTDEGSVATVLDDLGDVIVDTPADGHVLTYDSTFGTWRNEASNYTDASIHKAVADEISQISEKATPLAADLFLIESAADSYAKRRLTHANLRKSIFAPKWPTHLTGDDFDSTDLSAYSWTPSSPAAHDAHTTRPDHLYVYSSDATERFLLKDWSPTGDFDVRAKIALGDPASAGGTFGVVLTSADVNTARCLIQIANDFAGERLTIAAYTWAPSVWTARSQIYYLHSLPEFVLTITRSGGNVYFHFGDGWANRLMGSVAFSITVGKVGFRSASATQYAYVDWLALNG